MVESRPIGAVQHWFFEQELAEPHHFNQSVLLEVREPLTSEQWRRALAQLLQHHEALRYRFHRTDAGWRQTPAEPDGDVPFWELDFSGLSPAERTAELTRVQASLDFERGPLVRAALIARGPGETAWLLVVAHHLVVDTVSWRILVEDLNTLHGQLSRGEALVLPPTTTPFARCCELLDRHVSAGALDGEKPFWLDRLSRPTTAMPVDHPEGDNTEASANTVHVALGEDETRALVHDVPRAYRTQINDVLMTAVVLAFREVTGQGSLWLNLEGHGREDILDDADLLRTMGWFTSIFPVFLDVGGAAGEGEALQAVRDQMAAIPNRGIGYGLLRYMGEDRELQTRLRSMPEPEVSFNYLGQFGRGKDDDVRTPLAFCGASGGPEHASSSGRRNLLDVIGQISDGALRLRWIYSENVHERATIERLANAYVGALRRLISHCVEVGAVEAASVKHVAPRNAVEQHLAKLWEEVLEVERAGIHDNFFYELGGNSIQSMQVMARVRKDLGVDLPLRVLFQAPTIAQLAPHLQKDASDVDRRSYQASKNSLIPLQTSGTRPPLFLVSGAHADEDGFLRFIGSLLPHMGLDQPIYGFKARGLDGRTEPHKDAESMAADYIKELRAFQPEGPYLLAGNCIGGVVAYEMAQQLRRENQDVRMVALLDTDCPHDGFTEFVDDIYRFWKMERFIGHWRKLKRQSPRQWFDYVFSRLKKKFKHAVPTTEEARMESHIRRVEREYSMLLARYRPQPYEGPMTVILNEEQASVSPYAGWKNFAHGGIEAHVVPGDHVTRLSLNGGVVADILKRCIEQSLNGSLAGEAARAHQATPVEHQLN